MRRLFFRPAALSLLLLSGTLSAQTYIGLLNTTSNHSTFEVGLSLGQSETDLSTVGWTEVSGDTRIFGGSSNNILISNDGPYTVFSVRYDTGVAVAANTIYQLTFNLGFATNNVGNTANYSFQLGTVNSGVFTGLGSAYNGSLTYSNVGEYNLGSGFFSAVSQDWVTGANPGNDSLAVLFMLHSYSNATSDFFGFDRVSLTAAAVPEPSTYAVIIGALALAVTVLRRRRHA